VIARKVLFLTFMAITLSACQTKVTNQTSLNATWKYALVKIPKEMTTDGSRCSGTFASKKTRACMEKIIADRNFPLVLFMHGCAGFGSSNSAGGSRNSITTFTSLGYAVIAPDSFARLGRKKICSGNKRSILSLRQSEIEYALSKIPMLDWVDQSRLVLAGHSEGAQSVAEYSGDRVFSGYIILGFGCTRGIGRGPLGSNPVLAIQGKLDPLSKGVCYVNSNRFSDSVQVPKAYHDVSGYPETKKAVTKFMSSVAPNK
jgi:dienelactone hydrolase